MSDDAADRDTGEHKPAPRPKDRAEEERTRREPPETARHPAPGIDHEPEPDAENLIPRKEGPGTF